MPMRIDDGVNNYRFTEVDIDWALQTDEKSRSRIEMRAILLKLSKLVDRVTAPPVDEPRLTEATALLERCWHERHALPAGLAYTLAVWHKASRAPVQPAQAWHVRGATVVLGPAQPAAPILDDEGGDETPEEESDRRAAFCREGPCAPVFCPEPAASDLSPPNSTDGNVWAYQFCKRNPAVDEATMRLWFIGAVNAGLKAGRKAGRAEIAAPTSEHTMQCEAYESECICPQPAAPEPNAEPSDE